LLPMTCARATHRYVAGQGIAVWHAGLVRSCKGGRQDTHERSSRGHKLEVREARALNRRPPRPTHQRFQTAYAAATSKLGDPLPLSRVPCLPPRRDGATMGKSTFLQVHAVVAILAVPAGTAPRRAADRAQALCPVAILAV